MRYSAHAELRIIEYSLTKAEVAAIIANPARGTYEPKMLDRIEHYGFAANGRRMNVVTNRARSVVITVVPQ